MSGLTVQPPPASGLPTIGMPRSARGIKMGWHVQLPGDDWRLVLAPPLYNPGSDWMLITVREGLHDSRDVQLRGKTQVMTRTPPEQIAFIESERLARPLGRSMGPVSRLHLREQVSDALADALLAEAAGLGCDGECP